MRLLLNGEPFITSALSLSSLQSELKADPATSVLILNGYAATEDFPLHEGDEIFCFKKGTLPGQDAFEQMLCSRHTPQVHKKVKEGRIAIAGLGGLGSNIAIMLARTGIGHLHLLDFDVVEPSNLNRQAYKIKHLGLPKARALAEEIYETNPFVSVTAETLRLTEKNIPELLAEDSIICEAFDTPAAKAMLVNTVTAAFPDKFIVAASGMAGYGSSNAIITRKITDHFYLCGDGSTAAQPGQGLMAPRVMVCAGHQANMALRLLLQETSV
ncbi:MAG: sulfur carrier protein ThiS adenylyltransferase ThiF [Veillonellales bacterium]